MKKTKKEPVTELFILIFWVVFILGLIIIQKINK
jgi:hypothetical protein